MEFETTQEFPAGLDRLWAAFGSGDYVLHKYRALGSSGVRLRRFDAGADRIDVDLERDAPVEREQLPAWARRLVGATQTMRHRTTWRRASPSRIDAQLEITPLGLPVQALGHGSVEPAGERSRMTLHFRVASTLPVVGERVARLYARQIENALRADHAFTLRWLDAHAGGGVSRHDRPP